MAEQADKEEVDGAESLLVTDHARCNIVIG